VRIEDYEISNFIDICLDSVQLESGTDYDLAVHDDILSVLSEYIENQYGYGGIMASQGYIYVIDDFCDSLL